MDKDTSEYSSTKAPETRAEAEERETQPDSRLIPGGAEPRATNDPGMSSLDRGNLPNSATDSGQKSK
jgi:hypothetical protein